MPNKQNDITITIVSKNGNGLDANNREEVSGYLENENGEQTPEKTTKTSSKNNTIKIAASIAAAQLIEQAKYQANKYVSLSENYMFENTINFAESTIKNAIGIGSGIVSGFMVGGVIGAAVGGSFALLRTVIKNAETWEQQQIAINESNYNQNFSATRLGLEDNGKNTLN